MHRRPLPNIFCRTGSKEVPDSQHMLQAFGIIPAIQILSFPKEHATLSSSSRSLCDTRCPSIPSILTATLWRNATKQRKASRSDSRLGQISNRQEKKAWQGLLKSDIKLQWRRMAFSTSNSNNSQRAALPTQWAYSINHFRKASGHSLRRLCRQGKNQWTQLPYCASQLHFRNRITSASWTLTRKRIRCHGAWKLQPKKGSDNAHCYIEESMTKKVLFRKKCVWKQQREATYPPMCILRTRRWRLSNSGIQKKSNSQFKCFFAISSNNAQVQSSGGVIGLDLDHERITHEQLYVDISWIAYPWNICEFKKTRRQHHKYHSL